MDHNTTQAPRTTETQNPGEIDQPTNNIYEAVALIAKRAEQINDEIREELHNKLQEFATHTETLEEIFENKEQIEISKFYESLPKPTAIATEEWKEGDVYFRDPEGEEESE